MKLFSNMMSDLVQILTGAKNGSISKADIEPRLNSFKSLRSSLDFQWRKLESEWLKASSVEANLKRTPLMRAQMMRRAKSISQQMVMVGKFCNLTETFIFMLEQTKALCEHTEQLKKGIGDNLDQFNGLTNQVQNLMSQNETMLDSVMKIQDKINNFNERMDDIMPNDENNEEMGRLNELYERLETCQANGDIAEAKAVQDQITALMTGGSSLTFVQ